MRQWLLGLTVVGMAIAGATNSGFAQQQRPKTITFRQVSVSKTQWSTDSANTGNASSDNSGTIATDPSSGSPPATIPNPAVNATPTGYSPNSFPAGITATQHPDFGQRPSLQQLQNPSGSYQMTHTGFTQGQYTTTNNYFGSQFNNWNNLQMQPNSLDSFQSFNRSQPPFYVTSGAYISPNTYVGSINNQWSNLSSGTIAPNYLGSYIYQQ